MQWCHTDLGANVYSWQRLMSEDRRFGAPVHGTEGLGAEHFDGVMASSVLADGAHGACTRATKQGMVAMRAFGCMLCPEGGTVWCCRLDSASRDTCMLVRPQPQPAALYARGGCLG